MFEYEKENYEIESEEDEFYYWIIMNLVFNNFSPFETCDIDFPHKKELGGIVFKCIASGAIYFKIQEEMPSEKEINSVVEICRFLNEEIGGYVTARILCKPHIEINDIKLPKDENIRITYTSSRKSDGDAIIEILNEKLDKKEDFDIDDFRLRYILPFATYKTEESEEKYLKLLSKLKDCNLKLPDIHEELKKDFYEETHLYERYSPFSYLKLQLLNALRSQC